MFIEPTFSNLLHKALTAKPGTQKDVAAKPSFSEDDPQVAVYDDQGRDVFQHHRLWSVDAAEVDVVHGRERRERKTVAV